jgi:hypothetical protein
MQPHTFRAAQRVANLSTASSGRAWLSGFVCSNSTMTGDRYQMLFRSRCRRRAGPRLISDRD